jgi:hypothetical protein
MKILILPIYASNLRAQEAACSRLRMISFRRGRRPGARRLISFRLSILVSLRVVLGEVRRHRKCSRLEAIDAVPAFDPWARFVFTLHVKRKADHDVATVGPMLSHPGVIFFHPLDQSHKGVIEHTGPWGPDASLLMPAS